VVALVALSSVGTIAYVRTPDFADYQLLKDGELSEAQKQAVSSITELNKYLISLATAMFGALAFFLLRVQVAVKRRIMGATLFLVLLLLGITYYFAFAAYAQLTSELAQNALGLRPGYSRTLFYLEMEAWSFAGASATMLSLFSVVATQEIKA
jgi:hypothetical protein